MAAKHAAKVQQFEAQVTATLKERSKVFDEAFRDQLENYKKYGRMDSKLIPAVARETKFGHRWLV